MVWQKGTIGQKLMLLILVLHFQPSSAVSCQILFQTHNENSSLISYQALDSETRFQFDCLLREAGWAEVGGYLIRDDLGEVTGRTQWVPKSYWWTERPAWTRGNQGRRAKRGFPVYKHTYRQFIAATDRYMRGEQLGVVDSELIEFLLELAREDPRELELRMGFGFVTFPPIDEVPF